MVEGQSTEIMCTFYPEGVTHLPPKSCMPSRAKTTTKRKRRKSRLIIDFMELMRETTRFLRDAQYLAERNATLAHPLFKQIQHMNAIVFIIYATTHLFIYFFLQLGAASRIGMHAETNITSRPVSIS